MDKWVALLAAGLVLMALGVAACMVAYKVSVWRNIFGIAMLGCLAALPTFSLTIRNFGQLVSVGAASSVIITLAILHFLTVNIDRFFPLPAAVGPAAASPSGGLGMTAVLWLVGALLLVGGCYAAWLGIEGLRNFPTDIAATQPVTQPTTQAASRVQDETAKWLRWILPLGFGFALVHNFRERKPEDVGPRVQVGGFGLWW